jgi:hypothetical protein
VAAEHTHLVRFYIYIKNLMVIILFLSCLSTVAGRWPAGLPGKYAASTIDKLVSHLYILYTSVPFFFMNAPYIHSFCSLFQIEGESKKLVDSDGPIYSWILLLQAVPTEIKE